MTTPTLRGDWMINWSSMPASSMPQSLNELVQTSSPEICGTSVKVDDFCGRHNSDGSICPQGVLEFIPYGDPEDIVSSRTCAGDIAVYMIAKPMQFTKNTDRIVAAIKQRGFHAELCYRKNQQTWNASVWTDTFRDRRISELDANWILNVYRLIRPAGPIAQSASFRQSLNIWKSIYGRDNYIAPPRDDRWCLDPADFSSRDSLSQIAKVLLSTPPGSAPATSPVTCVQWTYTVWCLALLFPLSEEILDELGMRDVYAKYWLKDGGDFIAQDVPLLTDLPFRPYSPAQMLQAFLDTYCGGVDLFSILASGGGDQTKVEQLIQSGCPDQYRPDLLPYLRRVQETRDSTLQLDAVPHGFLMPSCFYCEERKRRHAQTDYWFEYVGTAMHKSLLTRRS